MRVTRSKIDGQGDHMAKRMLAKEPGVKADPVIDAPYVNNANQPSYYPPGNLPVVSTAGRFHQHEGREWEWQVKRVAPDSITEFIPGCAPENVPANLLRHDGQITLVKRGDWECWQIDTGQMDLLRGRQRQWETIDGRWQPLFEGCTNTQVHFSTPIVVTHLDSRPIVCESYAAVDAECARVGAEVKR